ncbi:hypothetical protein LIER_21664 [Lithospermum erythrorhizon]|uniref:Uncharacterized protein n=1 Tax=Lithospermum erythrorhizon TaxID=34254 RepID=A0AAV3QTZ5_LITER
MTGDRVPLFRLAKVVKKVSKDTVVTASPPAVASQSSSLSGRRPVVETCPSLFSKRQKSSARKLPRSEILDMTEDPPSSTPPGQDITEESTFWKKQDAFCATCPLLLERIRKDYDAIRDPLEIHGTVARHLIKALNPSHALACRADLLDDARVVTCEKEMVLQLQVTELKKENERLKVALNLAVKEKKEVTAQTLAEIKKQDLLQARFTKLEGEHFDISNKLQRLELVHSQTAKKISELEQRAKDAEEALPQRIEKAIYDYHCSEDFQVEVRKEAAYCLCHFAKTYKEVNPDIVANYLDFIQPYPEEWFAPSDLSAPLTPSPDEDEDEAPPAPADAPTS